MGPQDGPSSRGACVDTCARKAVFKIIAHLNANAAYDAIDGGKVWWEINTKYLTLGIVTLGPVVSSTRLSKDKVVRSENCSIRSSSYGIHGTRFQIEKDSPWNVFST